MSRLFGPFSVISSRVSLRACALAGDQIAGADTALAAVSAVIDFKNSRRFIEASWSLRGPLWHCFRKPRATPCSRLPHPNALIQWRLCMRSDEDRGAHKIHEQDKLIN